MKKSDFLFAMLILLSLSMFSQTKEDQLRKIKEDLKQQQEELKWLQERHDDAKIKEYDQLSKEKKLKEEELRRSLEEINKSKEAIRKSQLDLESKSKEADLSKQQLLLSQEEIDEAKKELEHQQDSIKLLTQEQTVKDLDLKNQKLFIEKQQQESRFLWAVIGLVSAIVLALVLLFFINRRTNKTLAQKNIALDEERKRSEDLLLNILPEDVVTELKKEGKTVPKNYVMATVLFADIQDFTKISERLSPEELVSSLDIYFESFDKILEKYNVEKIKTIGDAYVCVGGVPVANKSNPEEVVRVGLEFIQVVQKLKEEREKIGKPFFDVRIGIHSGPLVAGVVGIKKFAYDIWGDTVNMAARMQQHGEPLQLNISDVTYQIIKDKFFCIYRGPVEIKNKGLIDMYFVDREL